MMEHRVSSSKFKSSFVLLMLLMVLVACSSEQPLPTAQPEIEVVDIQITAEVALPPTLVPYEFATSEPGHVTLQGRLIVLDPQSILPAPDDAIYLVQLDPKAPISAVPQFEEDDDTVPQADVDERTGEFVFVNILPGRYAVVAVTKSGTQFPTRKMEDGSYAIFDLSETDLDQLIELSDLTLP